MCGGLLPSLSEAGMWADARLLGILGCSKLAALMPCGFRGCLPASMRIEAILDFFCFSSPYLSQHISCTGFPEAGWWQILPSSLLSSVHSLLGLSSHRVTS